MAERKHQYYLEHKEQLAEQRQRYLLANKERLAEQARNYRLANKERDAEHNREYHRKYREAHKERYAELKRQHRAANKEQYADRDRKYGSANRERKAEYLRAYRETNAEKLKEYSRKHYAENRQAELEQCRAWYLANRGKASANARNCQARANGAEGSFTAEDVKAIWVRQGMKCAVPSCTHPISDTVGSKHKFHVDHIRPFARGGSNWPSNLQILCRHHNRQKWNKDEREWAEQHGISLETKGNNEQAIS